MSLVLKGSLGQKFCFCLRLRVYLYGLIYLVLNRIEQAHVFLVLCLNHVAAVAYHLAELIVIVGVPLKGFLAFYHLVTRVFEHEEITHEG